MLRLVVLFKYPLKFYPIVNVWYIQLDENILLKFYFKSGQKAQGYHCLEGVH